MDIESIELELKSCESLTILPEFIEYFELENIKDGLYMGCVNKVIKTKTVEKTVLKIYENFKEVKHEYIYDWEWSVDGDKDIFDRLSIPDIESIVVHTNEGSIRYGLSWEKPLEEENGYQKTMRDSKGDFYILISKEETNIEDYFEFLLPFETPEFRFGGHLDI